MKTLRLKKQAEVSTIDSVAASLDQEHGAEKPSAFSFVSSDAFLGVSFLRGATTSPNPNFTSCRLNTVFWPYESTDTSVLGYTSRVQLLAHLLLHASKLQAGHSANTVLVTSSAGVQLAIYGRLRYGALSPALQCLFSLPRKTAPLGELNMASSTENQLVLSWEVILLKAICSTWFSQLSEPNKKFGCLVRQTSPDFLTVYRKAIVWFYRRAHSFLARFPECSWDDLCLLPEVFDFRLTYATPFLSNLSQKLLMALFDLLGNLRELVDPMYVLLLAQGVQSLVLKKAGWSAVPYLEEPSESEAVRQGVLITNYASRRNELMAAELVTAVARWYPGALATF